MKVILFTLSFLVLAPLSLAQAGKVIPASELSQGKIAEFLFNDYEQDSTLEFRIGDELSITVSVGGELFSTTDQKETTVRVEKDFFIKKNGDEILMSWDGTNFSPFKELVEGSASVKASGSSPQYPESIELGAKINIR